jgi:hypothetical protein
MSYGPQVVYTVSMASGGTSTAALDIARSYKTIYLERPTFGTGANLFIQAAPTLTGTYRRIFNPALNSSTVGINVFQILSAASNGFVPIPNGVRFLKIESSETIDNGATFNLICSD